MRYTETKLGKIAQYLTEDLEKNTVNYRNNYDETEKEPEVLPSHCLLYTSPSPRDKRQSRMPSSA